MFFKNLKHNNRFSKIFLTFNIALVLIVTTVIFVNAQIGIKPIETFRPPITGREAIVVSNQPLATVSGFKILEQGGNAIDAAVAVAASLSVVEPYLSNICGGDAFIIIYLAKENKVLVVNASGPAPQKATIDFYLNSKEGTIPSSGILSVEIPGAFSGWVKALKNYGTMMPAQVFQPAIELAEKGFVLSPYNESQISSGMKKFNDKAKEVYAPKGTPLLLGELCVNKNFAETLKKLGDAGWGAEDLFYRGEFAKKIVEFSEKEGGILAEKDFADFQAEIVDPLMVNYHGYEVYVSPPQCQGIVLMEALNILEPFDLKSLGHNSPEYLNLLIEALNLGFEDRNKYVGDPRFVPPIPLKGLLSKEYAAERRALIQPGKTLADKIPSVINPKDYEKDGNTTFFAVVDKDRNVVACTTSILDSWGSGLMAGDTGIFLNNRMNYFWLDPEHPNALEPGKRTFQTITPSIALKDGKPFMAFGTPGADVQEQTKLQIFFNVVLFGMNPQAAIEAPRFQSFNLPSASLPHSASPGKVGIEGRMGEETAEALRKMGYEIDLYTPWKYMGCAGMILINPENGNLLAGADPRREGYAIGW